MAEELIIDFSNVSLKPLGKKEIMQLEMALIIGTLYRPEVIELIRDPIERATWMDSLAVAAAALARYKAGMTTTQIAEELGRSEATIRSHLNQKTKAGKLVAETLEKMRKGELRLEIPFIKPQVAVSQEEIVTLKNELERLEKEKKVLEARTRELEEALKARGMELDRLRLELEEHAKRFEALKSDFERLTREKGELAARLNNCEDVLEKFKTVLQELLKEIERRKESTTLPEQS